MTDTEPNPSKLDLAKVVVSNIVSKKTSALAMGLIYLGFLARRPCEEMKLMAVIGGSLVASYMVCDLIKEAVKTYSINKEIKK